MRRTAVAVTGVGCAIGLFVAGGLGPASASARTSSNASASAMQTVEYDGYSVTVPASWQVFHLDSDPGQCVRYDINAVYLGRPGANQECPPDLMGRAETITITPAGVSRSSSQVSAAAQGGMVQAPPPGEPGRAISAKHSSFSHLRQYLQEHEMRASVTGGNVAVTATYGSSSAAVTHYLSSLHRARPIKARSPAGTAKAAVTPAPTKSPVTARPTSSPATTSTGEPSSTLTSTVKPSVPARPLYGFDTCTAPSLNAMKAWKSRYSAVGIYIGGQNMACDYGNLSASWIRSAHAQGWSLVPIYVGLQAPCNSFARISTSSPVTQGIQAANTAVADAANLGLGKRSPIYFDMEGYNNTNASCRSTVLKFLDAWTREVHARGYFSGVYSSAASGVSDLVATSRVNGHWMNEPDALWFALWDKNSNLTGTPYLPANRWATDRDKQYQGNQTLKIGGYRLTIDADRVGGAVSAP